MRRGKKLNESEKKQILELKQQQLSVAKISKVIMRSCKVIQNFLKNDYDKLAILRVASNSQLTTKQIMEKSNVSANVSSVRRVLLSCKDIKRLKLKKKTSLTTKHKVERLRFAERKNALEKETKKGTIFK